MKRFVFLLLVLAAAVACSENDTTAPTNLPLIYTAQLFPANEVPPVTNVESVGHGAVQVMFDVNRDSTNAVTGGRATFYFQLSGYPDGTTVTGAHIHPAVAGVNGPVIISTGLTGSNTLTLIGGTGDFSAGPIAVDAANMQGIINNPAAFYFNVHSPLNPGGFSRGQLSRIH